MTRAVLLDVDGVLVHSRFHPDPSKRRLWDAHLLADLGIDPARFQQLFDAEFMRVVTGHRSLVDILDAFLPSVGYAGSTLTFISYWMERDAHANLELLDAAARLRGSGQVRLYVATNQEHIRASYLWRELRLSHIFDDMFYAARLGAAKPDRLFFERVAERLPEGDLPPLFFDDSPRCVEAAKAFGWDAQIFVDIHDFTTHAWVQKQLF